MYHDLYTHEHHNYGCIANRSHGTGKNNTVLKLGICVFTLLFEPEFFFKLFARLNTYSS